MKKLSKQSANYIIIWSIFAFYMLVFMLTEFTVNSQTANIIGANSVNTIYSIGLVCTALGYLLFPLSRKFIVSQVGRKIIYITIGALAVIFEFGLVLSTTKYILLVCSFGALLSVGYIGSTIHYYASIALQNGKYTGRIIGIAVAFETLVQYFIQNYLSTNIALLISIIVSLTILVYICIRPPKNWIFENPLEYDKNPPNDKMEIIILLVVVCIMSVMISLDDAIVVYLDANSEVSITANARLFYGLSIIIAGFIADINKRAYIYLSTISVMIISVFVFAFLNSPELYTVNAALQYVYSGFYVLFFTVEFMDLAPLTKHPELWAGMGRVARSFIIAIFCVPSLWIYQAFGQTAMMIISFILSIAVLVLFFANGKLQNSSKTKVKETEEKIEQYSAIKFAKEYNFTPRETEVLEAVLKSDKSVKELAPELFVSERVLYRYLSSMYEKTETNSRIGLIVLYYTKEKESSVN